MSVVICLLGSGKSVVPGVKRKALQPHFKLKKEILDKDVEFNELVSKMGIIKTL